MIYFIQDSKSHAIKIGYSANGGEGRIKALQTGNAHALVALAEVPGDQAAERDLHDRFHEDRLCGEWFRPSPALLSHIVLSAVLAAGIAAGQAAQEAKSKGLENMNVGERARFCLSGDELGANVRCPVCGFDYSHIRQVQVGQVDWSRGEYESVALEFNGECGHVFAVRFRHHEGITNLEAEYLHDLPGYDGAVEDDPEFHP